jgi:hypothetical protein
VLPKARCFLKWKKKKKSVVFVLLPLRRGTRQLLGWGQGELLWGLVRWVPGILVLGHGGSFHPQAMGQVGAVRTARALMPAAPSAGPASLQSCKKCRINPCTRPVETAEAWQFACFACSFWLNWWLVWLSQRAIYSSAKEDWGGGEDGLRKTI